MPTLIAYPEPSRRWEHLLLGLRDPSVRVAVVCDEPVEPALLSYYLELAGVGPWDRLVTFSPSDVAGLRAFVGHDDVGVGRIDASFGWGSTGTSRVFAVIHDDRRVQILSAFDGSPCRHPASGDVGPLFRAAARAGAELAGAGAVGRFAVDLDGDDVVGVDPAASDHALSTMLALRANAVRCGWVSGSWRSVLDVLRSSGIAWNPVARAGVVVFPGVAGVELVALGSARTEAEERFSAAVSALSAPVALAA